MYIDGKVDERERGSGMNRRGGKGGGLILP
jgi:hypothetical protein